MKSSFSEFLTETALPTKVESWIKQIADDLGEELERYLGSGAFGFSFETKSGKILKITLDPVEIKLAYRLSKNRNWAEYLINYYNIGKTNKKMEDSDGITRNAYYLLMDKVDPIENTPVGYVIDGVYQDLIQYKTRYYTNIMSKRKVQEAIRREYPRGSDQYNLAKEIYPHIVNIVKDLKKHGIRETDFHSGNIGWDKNHTKLILYDLGGYIDNTTGIIIKNKLKKIKVKNKLPDFTPEFSESIITHFSDFLNETLREEYPDMFGPRPEIKPVPGFEGGTIDPDDEDPYGDDNKTDKERYEEFIKVTKERNFQETQNEIIINVYRLWQDFYMSIYEAEKHFKKFVRNELTGKYISKGFIDIMTDENTEGIIQAVGFIFDEETCLIEFRLKNQPITKNSFCEEFITLDKLKSTASKYNL